MRQYLRSSTKCLLIAGVFAVAACTVNKDDDSPDAAGTTAGSGGAGGSAGSSGTSGSGGNAGSSGAGGNSGSAGSGASGGTSGAGGTTGGNPDAGTGGASGAGNGGAAGTAGRSGAAGSAGSANDGGRVPEGGADSSADAVSTDGSSPVDSGVVDQGTPIEAGSDRCTGGDPGNEDRDHASPIAIGSDFQGCLQTLTDVDFYEFTTPDMPAAGGVIVLSLTEVSAGGLTSTVYAATDNGAIHSNNGTTGASVFQWFAAAPSAKYRVEVKNFSGAAPAPYTLKVTYAPVNDANEPNDTRMQAKAITIGTPQAGYFFTGYLNSTGLAANAWEDWFKVTLADGSATVTLSDLASDIDGQLALYDNLGVQVATVSQPTDGATVVLTKTGIVAGDYYVKANPFSPPTPKGNGTVPGVYTTQPYALTVTQ